MTKVPYPGYPPSYKIVDTIGGYHRTCVVVELLSLGPLEPVMLAYIQEQLEAIVDRQKQQNPLIERTDVVLPDRFDPVLRGGLRLSVSPE